jgi:hypothetical protein
MFAVWIVRVQIYSSLSGLRLATTLVPSVLQAL